MRRVRSSHNYLLFPFHPIRFILDADHGGHKDKCKCKLQVKLSEVQHQHQHQHHLLLASCMSCPVICTLAQGSRVARTVPIVREHSTAKYLPVCRRVPPSLPFAQGRSLQPCCASCSKHNPIFVILPVLGKKRSSTHPVGCGCVPVPSPPAPKRSTALPSPPPAAHDSPVPMWLCCRAAAHCPRRHRCRFLALFFFFIFSLGRNPFFLVRSEVLTRSRISVQFAIAFREILFSSDYKYNGPEQRRCAC